MSEPVIRIENLGKKYRLGQATGGGARTYRRVGDALREAATAPARWLRGGHHPAAPDAADFWALQDVSLDIHQGDVIGIIGRNGAGKSTLLKILSRITEPTTGRIEIEGRLASLLEVGTGFHPELTGRENVFLNGAILGMSRAEVRSKFDAIVAFAEVEQFIDTPVKRYSSGMYVRLAFAVAAHLEPDILVVDEVLAVGDVQFQKKCLGKMSEISATRGRTVLFVSHNLGTIGALCNKSVLLRAGRVVSIGPTHRVVEDYLSGFRDDATHEVTFKPDFNQPAGLRSASVSALDPSGQPGSFSVTADIRVTIAYSVHRDARGLNLALCLKRNGTPLFLSFDTDCSPELTDHRRAGDYVAELLLPRILKAGSYSLSLSMGFTGLGVVDRRDDALSFDLEELGMDYSMKSYEASRVGEIACPIKWELRRGPRE
jgi:lipopolysaccharide transport system ATP-binding protein